MLIIHATQKLLNTSRLPPVAYVTKASEGQLLHSWYAMVFSSSFPGKLMTMYVHQPTLLTVVCKGKTIKNTWPEFLGRLPKTLIRYGFSPQRIEREMKMADDYVVAKTENKSMLACMNQIAYDLEYNCSRFPAWEDISLSYLEEIVMESIFGVKELRHRYISPPEYWQQIFSNEQDDT